MNILFLMISYPDVGVNSSMYTDLAHELALKEHDVFVIAANGLNKTTLTIEGGIRVLRVRTLELFDTSFIKKGMANLMLPYQVLYAFRRYYSDIHFDAIISSTPPVTYLITINKLKKRYKSQVYLILRDIFPQNARDLGLIKSNLLFNFFRRKEKKLYEIADHIGCMSNGNINYINEHNPEIRKTKLHLLPNWKNIKKYTEPDNSIRERHDLQGKFIVLYGGNLGKPQDVEFIIEIAELVSQINNVVFLIVGDGTEKKKMKDVCRGKNLINVIFMDPLPRNKYEDLVKVCDIGLIVNNRRFTIPNIPSRTLSYWEAKLPILAAIDPYTDYKVILEKSGSGFWSLTGDVKSFRNNFDILYKDKDLRQKMGQNGYAYLIENCSTSKACNTIIDRLNSER